MARARLLITCAGNRRPMIRTTKKLPFRQRKRRKYQDLPREIEGLTPDDAEFNGRLSSEIGGSNGPRHLSSLVLQFGPSLLPSHLSLALSKLAGFATKHGGGGGLSPSDSELISTTARRCSSVLLIKVDDIQPMQAAMSIYSLGRLGIRNQALMAAIVRQTFDLLGTLTPQGLSSLLSGLASLNNIPSDEWLGRFCIESYLRMGRFEAVDIANTLYAFVRMRVYRPSDIWLYSAQKTLKLKLGVSCNAPSLVRAAFSLAKLLGSQPSPSKSSPNFPLLPSERSLPPPSPRPSLNFMTSLTAQAKLFINAYTARELAALLWSILELGHAPDATFYQLWNRASARRMASFDSSSLPLMLDSMQRYGAMTRVLPPPSTLTQLLLAKLESLHPLMGADAMAHCLHCLVKMRVRPPEGWMESFDAAVSLAIAGGSERALSLEWEEQREASSSSFHVKKNEAIDRVSQPMSGGGIGELAWSYGRLRYQPSESVREALVSRVQSLLRDQKELKITGRYDDDPRKGRSDNDQIISLTDLGLVLWAIKRSRILLPAAVYEAWKGACIGMIRTETKLEGSGRDILDRYMKTIEEGEGEGTWNKDVGQISPPMQAANASQEVMSGRPAMSTALSILQASAKVEA